MKAIITKYATTSGPKLVTGKSDESHYGRSFVVLGEWGHDYYHRDDFQLTRGDAWSDINKRFERRRKSLEKELAGLEKKRKAAIALIELMAID